MKLLRPTLTVLVSLGVACAAPSAGAQAMPKTGGTSSVPDEWLLATQGPRWWYPASASTKPTELGKRDPTADERAVVERARSMLAGNPAKAVALIDNGKVVFVDYKAPANAESLFHGFSMGKTVAAMSVGQAICGGKLKMGQRADELVPELVGKALGTATVRDLLRMASGANRPDSDGSMFTPEQLREWNAGRLTLLPIIASERVSKAERGVFSDYKPGEHFSYKNQDPNVLGLMIRQATGMTFSEWTQLRVFEPMGMAHRGLVVQDQNSDGMAEGGVRLRLEDWIRFAVWVKNSSKESGCFGDYVREAASTQIKNGPSKGQRDTGKLFGGYGYFIWTENEYAPGSYWASGYGGQRIAWFKDSDRQVVVFSNVESYMDQVYELAHAWGRIGR